MSNAIKELEDFLRNHQDFYNAFDQSLQEAKQRCHAFNIDFFDKFDTLDDYVAWYKTFLTWVPEENKDGTMVINNLCTFYYVIDSGPVKNFQSGILPESEHHWTWLSTWLVTFAKELGAFMDTPKSLTHDSLATFYSAPNYHMQDYHPLEGAPWKTYNEFFARKFTDYAKSRPIDGKDDPKIIVSPADSVFDGAWRIDKQAKVEFTSKGIPWTIGELLQDSTYGERFKGGLFMHSFLGPSDYHRQHAPVAGKVLEAKVIEGLCYLEVVVAQVKDQEGKLTMKRKLDAPDSPGYQFIQSRSLILIDTESPLGIVAVLPMGMAQVSSIKLSVEPGQTVTKGQEISYFQFGGSDIVMCFEEKANLLVTAIHEHYNFGKQLAVSLPFPKK